VAALRRIACLPALLLAASWQVVAHDGRTVADALQRSSSIERLLGTPEVPATALAAVEPQLRELGGLARACIESSGADMDKLDKDLALVGKPAAGEDAAVAKARRDMQDQQKRIGRTLASCRLLLVRSDALTERLQSRLDQAQAQRLLGRGPDLGVLLHSLQGLPAAASRLWGRWRETRLGLTVPGRAGYALLAILTLLALGAGLRLRGWLAAHVAGKPADGLAAAQPLVLADATVVEPRVLFLGFGDSALNLELRFFVRDINQRLTVLSEVNFAIDAAFRKAGIEIPFPQRDLHLRGGPEAPSSGRA
jgi:hypothetical protein